MKGKLTPSGFCSQQRSRSGRGNSHGPSRAKRCCTHEVHVEVAIVRAVALQLADRARREVAHAALTADLAQPLGSGVGRWLEPAVTLAVEGARVRGRPQDVKLLLVVNAREVAGRGAVCEDLQSRDRARIEAVCGSKASQGSAPKHVLKMALLLAKVF